MAAFPGKYERISAPYSRFYSDPAAVNLTTEVPQARNASTGMVLIATGDGAALTYKDCAGTSVAITGINDAAVIHLPFAATELTSSTTMDVLVYWHPSTAT
jgi:hypothetical protein